MSDTERPPECAECGSSHKETVQHHTSYQKDLTIPVCRGCHQKIHGNKDHPLFPDDRPEETCLQISNRLADELFERKQRGESYEDVIWRLIEEADDE